MKPPEHDADWTADVEALYRHDMQEIWDPTINRHIWNQYHNQIDLYLSVVAEAAGGAKVDILDVGCAQATLALKLAELGHKVVANDLRQSFLDYAQSRYTHGHISYVCGNILEMKIDQRFDHIFANQIIEHLVYPEVLVERLKTLLKPNGQLVITTPSWHYLKNDLPKFTELGDPKQYEDRQFTADADGHFFAYTETELRSVLQAQGFRDIRIRFFETPFISGHMRVRHIHGLVPAGLLRLMDAALLATPVGKPLAHQLMVIGKA